MKNNTIIGQSGGPTAVINASLAGIFSASAKDGGRVYGMRHGVQGLLKEAPADLSARIRTPADIELLKKTPAACLGSCRYRLPDAAADPALYRRLFAIFDSLAIGRFFYIGGNDSMDTIRKLADYGAAAGSAIRFVGAPKTIDNDLPMTDHAPGYGSAAKYIGVSMKELIRDSLVYDERRVTLVEIMGRNAGWLAGAAALSRCGDCEGPDLIYLPEAPFDPEDFVCRVQALQQKKKSVVIALSEGIRTADGRYVCELSQAEGATDVFGHRQLSGAGSYLASLLTHRLNAKCRSVELSTMQRCAAHVASQTDIDEAFAVGEAAVHAAGRGETGVMAVLRRLSDEPYACTCETADIHAVANLEQCVPAGWIDRKTPGVTGDFLRYLRPLVQGEPTLEWKDGLPVHFRL